MTGYSTTSRKQPRFPPQVEKSSTWPTAEPTSSRPTPRWHSANWINVTPTYKPLPFGVSTFAVSTDVKPKRRTQARLILAAAAMVSTVAVTGTSEAPHHYDCTVAAASATCTVSGASWPSTAPKKLDVFPRSDDPRWLALGYNPKWPHLGYDPKWQSFGYEPQYNGFQPPATLRRFRSTQSLPAELHRLPSEDG